MNITYLLGAGASCEALPIVNKIPKRLDDFANQFKINSLEWLIENQQKARISEKYILDIKEPEIQKQKFNAINEFYKDILWLKEESTKHTSIDTFAKKLYLKDEYQKLKKLKLILSCFFIYLQKIENGFDKRYDAFFASILEDVNNLPKNLKILSWNYDSQIEIAFKKFTDYPLDICKSILRLQSKGLANRYRDHGPEIFSMYKINGTTDISLNRNKEHPIIPDLDIDDEKMIETFIKNHNNLNLENYYPTLSFAWENESSNQFFNKISNSVINTEILIIIGYSFPFFNRKIDEKLLSFMPNLSKVYVQDPQYSLEIIEKIKGLIPNYDKAGITKDSNLIEFKAITYTDQFFIPIEF